MSFGKECSFSSSSGAASRVFHFKITPPQSRDSTTQNTDEKGRGQPMRVGRGQLSGFHWFARKIDIRSPPAPSRVVSACGPWRSSSPPQGRAYLSRSAWGSPLSGAGLPLNLWRWGKKQPRRWICPRPVSISSLDSLSHVVVKSLKSQGARGLD